MTMTSIPAPESLPDFATFKAAKLACGFQEVIARSWEPNAKPGCHSHPFDAEALVVEGEMWLRTGGKTEHLLPGDEFKILAGTEHDEWYGAAGATYWVARRDKG